MRRYRKQGSRQATRPKAATPPQKRTQVLEKWHGNVPELVELVRACIARNPRSMPDRRYGLPDHLLPQSLRRAPVVPGSLPAITRAVPKSGEVIDRGKIPAVREYRGTCDVDRYGVRTCDAPYPPETECRNWWCPHVQEMRTRLRRRLRQYAPGKRLPVERWLSLTDTVE